MLVRGEQSASRGEAFIRHARRVSLAVLFTVLLGGVMTWFGLFGQPRIDFVYYTGIILMAYGVFLGVRWLRAPKHLPEPPNSALQRTRPRATFTLISSSVVRVRVR